VPSVVAISVLTFLIWIIFSGNFAYAISSAICVLIISCPCALGLATPIAIVSSLARGAKAGILVKNPEVLELIKDAKFVAFDKTGTLSKGLISVKSSNLSEKELELVASAENLSEHPISKAIVRYAKQNCINLQKLNGKFQNVVGQGIVYEDESNKIIIGNEKLLAANNILLNEADIEAIKEATNDGSGVILCALNQKFSGFLTLSDELKNEIEITKNATRENANLLLNLAINYGSKNEIIRAVRKLNLKGCEINEASLNAALDESEPVDLLIRTGGESRLSNFMLWQASYAELFFTPTLWPDFGKDELASIVAKFKDIERRFGGV